MQNEYDVEMMEILLDKPVFCGTCVNQMKEIRSHVFMCGNCGIKYKEDDNNVGG